MKDVSRNLARVKGNPFLTKKDISAINDAIFEMELGDATPNSEPVIISKVDLNPPMRFRVTDIVFLVLFIFAFVGLIVSRLL